MGLRSIMEYVACVFLSPESKLKLTSAGQRVLIINSWLCRAAMTMPASTPLRWVKMWEVGIVMVGMLGDRSVKVGCGVLGSLIVMVTWLCTRCLLAGSVLLIAKSHLSILYTHLITLFNTR